MLRSVSQRPRIVCRAPRCGIVGQMKAASEKLPETASLFSGSTTSRKLPSWVNCFLTAQRPLTGHSSSTST